MYTASLSNIKGCHIIIVYQDNQLLWITSTDSQPTTSIEMKIGVSYKITKVIYKVMVDDELNIKYHPQSGIVNNPTGHSVKYHIVLEER